MTTHRFTSDGESGPGKAVEALALKLPRYSVRPIRSSSCLWLNTPQNVGDDGLAAGVVGAGGTISSRGGVEANTRGSDGTDNAGGVMQVGERLKKDRLGCARLLKAHRAGVASGPRETFPSLMTDDVRRPA